MKRLIILFLITGSLLNLHGQLTLQDNLLLYYPFNGDATDESGNGLNGIPEGAVVSTKDRFGNPNSAYRFDGVDDGISTNSALFSNYTNVTVCYWVKTTSHSQDPDKMPILNGWYDYDSQGINLYIQDSTANMNVDIPGSGNTQILKGTRYITDGRWHFVVCQFDNNNDIGRIYIDGIPAGETGITNYPLSSGEIYLIGKDGTSANYFEGDLDDIRIYDRLLSEAEIYKLYHENDWVDLEAGLLAFYPLNGNTEDASVNGNDATVGNNPRPDLNGKIGTAYYFDGEGDYIETPIKVSDYESGSISCWAHPNSIIYHDMIFADRGASGDYLQGLFYNPTGNFRLQVVKSGTSYILNYKSPGANKWSHIVFTWGSEGLMLYINGVLVDSEAVTGGWDNDYLLWMGCNHINFNYSEVITGNIDEFGVWERQLTDNEVSKLYHKHSGMTLNPNFDFFLEGDDPNAGLLAWYPLDGNADDLSLNGNDGSIQSATGTTDRNSEPGSALNLDGVDDKISLPELALDFPFSVACWVNPDFSDPNYSPGLFYSDFWDPFAADYYGFAVFLNTDGSIAAQFGNGNGSISTITRGAVSAAGEITEDTWQHIVINYTSFDNITIYKNGELLTTTDSWNTSLTSVAFTGETDEIGANDWSGGGGEGYWKGLIDDFRVYKYPMEESVISRLYAGILPPHVIDLDIGIENATLKWTGDTSGLIKEYNVYRDSTFISTITNSPGSLISYTNEGLTAGEFYVFNVTAVDIYDNESWYSENIYAIPSANPTVSVLENWQYSQEILVHSQNEELFNYQLPITLTPWNFDYSNSRGTDGSDLRFSSDLLSNELYYCIEEWNENDSSIVWVKVPHIPIDDTISIFMYYGNESAVDFSNPDSVFLFYDDFDDGNWRNKWLQVRSDEEQGYPTITEADGKITFTNCCQSCPDGNAITSSHKSFYLDNQPFVIDATFSIGSDDAGYSAFQFGLSGEWMYDDPFILWNRIYGIYINNHGPDDTRVFIPAEQLAGADLIDYPLNTPYRIKLKYDGSAGSDLFVFNNTGNLMAHRRDDFSYESRALLKANIYTDSPGSYLSRFKVHLEANTLPTYRMKGVPDPLEVSFQTSNANGIGRADGSIDITVSGGISPYTYTWSNGSTAEDISGLSAGVYSVTVTDSRDSTMIDSIRIYNTFVDGRDGQRYKVITIGGQVWMAENLRAIIYPDSTPLVDGTGAGNVQGDYTTKYYFWYSDDSVSHAETYGALYTWPAAMNGAAGSNENPSGVQGVCPSGWHLPSDSEWKELEMFLGMSKTEANGMIDRGTTEGNKLKETGTAHWNIPNSNSTNSSGFTAIPGGYRTYHGGFDNMGIRAAFWSSTDSLSTHSWERKLSLDRSDVYRNIYYKNWGYSVRCIKDAQQISLQFETENCTSIEGNDGSIDLIIDGGIAPFTILWSDNSVTQNMSGLSAGVYSVTVTDANDSTVTDSVRIYDTFIDKRDGMRYKTVSIGDQVWMAQNLAATKYADGTPVPLVESFSEWEALGLTDKACSYYINDSTQYADTYGALYTWAAAMNGTASSDTNPSGVQGVCPSGWHLPSDSEWKELEMYLGMNQANADAIGLRGTDEGGKLKLADTTYWTSPNTGATNSSGFTALPGGYRFETVNFIYMGRYGFFWTSTEADNDNAYFRRLYYNYSNSARGNKDKNIGYSVRCVQDSLSCRIEDIQLTGENVSCFHGNDGSITVTVTGNSNFTYSWDSGQDTKSISGLSSGWYKITVTDTVDCSLTDSIEILEPPLLMSDITDSSNVSFHEASDGSAIVTPSGGTPPYYYLWDDDPGSTDSTVSGLSANIWYHVEITDENGCTVKDSVILSEPGLMNIDITDSSNVSCYGLKDGTATVFAWGGTPPFVYQWDDDSATTSATVQNLEADRWYRIIVMDDNLDSVIDSVMLSEPDPFEISKDYTNKICAGSSDGYISLDVSGGIEPYNYNWNTGAETGSVSSLGPGKYFVTISDDNGCIVEDSTLIDSIKTYQDAEICMVTVNNDNRILVVWEKIYNEGIAAYNIYREQSAKDNYVKIGTVPFDSLSIFLDDSSLPQDYAHFYKISITDSCGNESELSPHHKSIYLQTNLGLSSEVNLNWDEYEGFDYFKYEVYRGSTLNNLFSILTISSSNRSWSDNNPPSGLNYYRIQVVKPEPCYPSGSKKSDEITSPFSNYDEETIVVINDLIYNNLQVYPNPFDQSTTIRFNNPERHEYTLYIMDISGKVRRIVNDINSAEYILEKGNLEKGFYFVELRGPEILRGKIVIE